MTDEAVLAHATAEGRALLALNRKHFIRLHGLSSEHAGIVVSTFDPDFEGLARRIHSTIAGQVQLSGQLVRISRSTP